VKCAGCQQPTTGGMWIITHVEQSRGLTSTYCTWCLIECLGRVAYHRLEHKINFDGWVQEPLPLDAGAP
jgi:hypothetical protein